MNQRDMINLHFLLSADENAMKEWYDSTSDDDHKYAMEIMIAYQNELVTKLELLSIENIPVNNIELAATALSKFRK